MVYIPEQSWEDIRAQQKLAIREKSTGELSEFTKNAARQLPDLVAEFFRSLNDRDAAQRAQIALKVALAIVDDASEELARRY
jgi:hypothetical protein